MGDVNWAQVEIDDAMRTHNNARAAKGLQPLVWDSNLANDAQAWAQNLADRGAFEHSHADGQGENLYWTSNETSFEDAVEGWLAEESNYHGENIGDGDFGSYGHYTQCMWSSTTNVGIAKARKGDATYTVARYTPPGNFVGQKPY